MKKKNTDAKQPPVHALKMGAIRASIWANKLENGTLYNVTFSRLYKKGDEWKDSSSFGPNDLPLLGKLTELAHEWILETKEAK